MKLPASKPSFYSQKHTEQLIQTVRLRCSLRPNAQLYGETVPAEQRNWEGRLREREGKKAETTPSSAAAAALRDWEALRAHLLPVKKDDDTPSEAETECWWGDPLLRPILTSLPVCRVRVCAHGFCWRAGRERSAVDVFVRKRRGSAVTLNCVPWRWQVTAQGRGAHAVNELLLPALSIWVAELFTWYIILGLSRLLEKRVETKEINPCIPSSLQMSCVLIPIN